MGSALLGGLAAAAGAAACYDTAYALQALEARRVDARHALRPSLLRALVRRPLWLGASALAVAGWPLQLLALSLAPLTLVQPTLALGLLLLLALARPVLGERVGVRELAGALAVVGGVAGVALAAPGRTTHHAGGLALAAGLGVLGLAALLPYALRIGPALVVGAGAGDAWAAFAAKLVVDELSHRKWVAAAAFACGAGLALAAAVLSEMSALQRYAATRVGPVVLVLQIGVPIALAPLLGGERWGSALLVASLALAVGGALVLASSSAVARFGRERQDE